MSTGWYRKSQIKTETHDLSQIMQETMAFAEELMREFEELRAYATETIPRRAQEFARIATNPETQQNLLPALNAWGEEMSNASNRLNQAAINNQSMHKELRTKWDALMQAADQLQVGSATPSAPSAESVNPGVG